MYCIILENHFFKNTIYKLKSHFFINIKLQGPQKAPKAEQTNFIKTNFKKNSRFFWYLSLIFNVSSRECEILRKMVNVLNVYFYWILFTFFLNKKKLKKRSVATGRFSPWLFYFLLNCSNNKPKKNIFLGPPKHF